MSESDYFTTSKDNAHKTGKFGTSNSQRLLSNNPSYREQQDDKEAFPQIANQARKEKRSPSDEQKR